MDFEKHFLQQLELERVYRKDETETSEFMLKHEIIFNNMVLVYEELTRLNHNFNVMNKK